ncbi:MAG: L-aspartate oxidase [Bacteroidota bacterium]
MTSHDLLKTDVLVIGCGIAGGVAALELAEVGVHVTVVTLSPRPEETNTLYAQGGIVYQGDDDSPELLVEDILRAGAGFSNRSAVEILAREGPALVRSLLLEKIGVPFDRTANDEFSLVREGGHSLHRILHAADATGSAIERRLLSALSRFKNVTILTGHTAVDLLTPAHHAIDRQSIYAPPSCVGAYILNQGTEQVVRCLAKATILATGGLGQIFLRSTNPLGSRGDGLAMAYRAGARVINCEFIQFHPTAFYKQHAPFFLISEAVRGAGARLVDERGEPFMQRYDAEWKDLAPRDVVSRSIHHEMLARNLPNVYLDIASHLPAAKIREMFPSIHEQCLRHGVDMSREPIPVVPAAHYFCGGVWVDEYGRTTVENLFAVGEVSCTGIHGANRLASTSLLEGLVWGHRAARHLHGELRSLDLHDPHDIPSWVETGTEEPDAALIHQDISAIQHVMWNYVGLVRTDRRLQRAIRELRHLEYEIERFYRAVKLTDGLIGLRNAVRSALIVTIAAWENKKSVGCHYRV